MTSTKVADAKNPYDCIIDIITEFDFDKTIVDFTCDDGDNLNKCSDIICYDLDHTALFTPNKYLFAMDFLEYVISGAWKAGVVDV